MQRLSVKQVINLQALVNRIKADRTAKAITRDALLTTIKQLKIEEHKLTVDINTLDVVLTQVVGFSAPSNDHSQRVKSALWYAENQGEGFFNKKLARKVLGRARRIVTSE